MVSVVLTVCLQKYAKKKKILLTNGIWGKNHLQCILFILHYYKHNEIDIDF